MDTSRVSTAVTSPDGFRLLPPAAGDRPGTPNMFDS
jgi:hypothetical protein